MSLVKESEPSFMTAEGAARRHGYAARSELALRNRLDAFCRERWPAARVVHELVMGEGQVRADVVAIDPAHLAAFEIKGEHDNTTRLLHQVAMYQLCVPEVWMVVTDQHSTDARLIRHLLPSVGLIVATGIKDYWQRNEEPNIDFVEVIEAAPRPVVPEMMLRMLWRGELATACIASGRYAASGKTPRKPMVKALLDAPIDEITRLVCAQLRSRDALWRADAPVAAVSFERLAPEARVPVEERR